MIVITTCNREGMLKDLLSQIDKQYTEKVLVVDDGTENEIIFPEYNFDLSYHRFEFRHGKKRYFEVISYIFNYLKSQEFTYLWQLPDDVSISPQFFEQSIRLWESIKDEYKACLSTGHTDLRHTKSCWSDFIPQKVNEEIYKTQWMDLCYICTHSMLNALKYDVDKPDTDRWKEAPELGSGVGANISRRLIKLGLNMYHVNKSLVEFLPGVVSRMHV